MQYVYRPGDLARVIDIYSPLLATRVRIIRQLELGFNPQRLPNGATIQRYLVRTPRGIRRTVSELQITLLQTREGWPDNAK